VICSVQFGQQERDIVQRSGLLDYVIWQGPEEQYFADDDLKHNLSLRPITKGAFTGSMVALVGFEALVEPDDRPYVRQPLTRRQTIYARDLVAGQPCVICDCETLAEANAVEHQLHQGLVKLKELITFNDKPANRVSTFKL
jgi:hypothetical protein